MVRVGGHALTVLAALSLLLCVAVGAVWVRSEFHRDVVGGNASYPRWSKAVAFSSDTSNGRVCLQGAIFYGEYSRARPTGGEWYHLSTASGDFEPSSDPRGDFHFVRWGYFSRRTESEQSGSLAQYTVILRLWQLAALTAVAPLLSIRRTLRRRRATSAGLCPQCGYNLRATPRRCPECGRIPDTFEVAHSLVGGIIVSALTLAMLTGCATDAGSHAIATDAAAMTSRPLDTPEPERVVREFMIALARGDREGMLAHMRPNAGVDVLLRMRHPEAEAELVELFRTLPITRLKAGDQLADPFVPGQRILPEMIDEDHLILIMHTKGKAAWTYFLVREKGRWRLNLDWFIEWLNEPESAPRIEPGSPPRIVV